MSSITSLPKEILFASVSGDPSVNRTSIRNFGYNCRYLRDTCWTLRTQIDALWKECLPTFLYKEHFPPFRFVINWIDGTPIINPPFEPENIHKYSLESFLLKKNPILLYHFHELREAETLAYIDMDSNLSFQDICAWHDLEDGVSRPFLTERIQPLVYKDDVVAAFDTQNEYFELRYYTPDPHGALEEKSKKRISPVHSLQKLEEFILLEFENTIAGITFEGLKNSQDFLFSEDLQGSKFLKAFSSELLYYKPRPGQPPAFYMLYVEDMQLKINPCPVAGNDLDNVHFQDWDHAFHERAQCTIFVFHESHHYRLGVISTNELTPSEPQTMLLTDPMQIRSAKLIVFGDTVLLCSLDLTGHFQIQSIDLNEGIKLTPLELKGEQTFKSLINVFIHLDKLFITGSIQDGFIFISHRLIVIDMVDLKVESAVTIREMRALDVKIRFIASGIGKVHLLYPDRCDLKIFNIDYT